MRNTAIALTLLIVFSAGVYAQSPPTLRIVTETPNLPSELYYGDIKVKPLRLRPGTTTPITIDDSDFFVHQHYIDFLTRFAEPQGFADWMAYLNREQQACPTNPECLHQARITASSMFFGSEEFNLKGGYVFRFYKSSLARLPSYDEMTAGMRAVTGATGPEVFQKRIQFSNDWVVRQDFLTAFPRSLSPTEFVNNVIQVAGVGVANQQQIIADLTAAGNNDTGRATAMRAIIDSDEVKKHEFNPSFVYMQYVGYLRRAPETEGYNNWLNYLNANPTDFRTMVRGFMDSTEYRARF